MSKKRIADSIIIRVGGGIREVPREPMVNTESLGAGHRKPGFEQTEDVHPFGVEQETNTKGGPEKIIN
jgi:hypothetical protein